LKFKILKVAIQSKFEQADREIFKIGVRWFFAEANSLKIISKDAA
jgi:hypothetical protein